jgi:hypothetical protein
VLSFHCSPNIARDPSDYPQRNFKSESRHLIFVSFRAVHIFVILSNHCSTRYTSFIPSRHPPALFPSCGRIMGILLVHPGGRRLIISILNNGRSLSMDLIFPINSTRDPFLYIQVELVRSLLLLAGTNNPRFVIHSSSLPHYPLTIQLQHPI